MLRDDLFNLNLRNTTVNGNLIKRTTDSTIVDEVDNLLLDSALDSARLAIESPY